MSVLINTNSAATSAANNLAASNGLLRRSLNRLSSGAKIIYPADDAGGLAVSMKFSAATRRQGAVMTNLGNSTSYLQSQDGTLKAAGKVLERIGELKTLASDPTKNSTDLDNYHAEFTALQAQLTSLTAEKFNGVAHFGSTTLGVAATEGDGGTIDFGGVDLAGGGGGPGNFADVMSAPSLTALNLSTLTGALQDVATYRAQNGAQHSRLGYASEVLATYKANLEAANSRILDVDVAEESTHLARYNVLAQAGTSMLAQANQSSRNALRLLG